MNPCLEHFVIECVWKLFLAWFENKKVSEILYNILFIRLTECRKWSLFFKQRENCIIFGPFFVRLLLNVMINKLQIISSASRYKIHTIEKVRK